MTIGTCLKMMIGTWLRSGAPALQCPRFSPQHLVTMISVFRVLGKALLSPWWAALGRKRLYWTGWTDSVRQLYMFMYVGEKSCICIDSFSKLFCFLELVPLFRLFTQIAIQSWARTTLDSAVMDPPTPSVLCLRNQLRSFPPSATQPVQHWRCVCVCVCACTCLLCECSGGVSPEESNCLNPFLDCCRYTL